MNALSYAVLIVAALALGCSGPTQPPEAQSPIMARLWIDQVEAHPETVSELCVRLSSDGNPAIAAEEVGGLDFLLYYDMAALSFQSIKRDSVLSDWEYWTYRLMEPGKPMRDSIALIRILAYRNLDNGVDSQAPSGLSDGPLLRMGFLATSDWQFVGIDSPVGFWRESCNDNTIWHADDPTTLLIANMDHSPGEDYLAFDTLACARRLSLDPSLAFQGGSVRITAPPDVRPLAGDLNLDGQRFTIEDAATLSSYFTGDFQWVSEDSLRQLEAADCNGDGDPFTVSDIEFMYRVVFGEIPWWFQIPEPYLDTLYVEDEHDGDTIAYSLTASANSTFLFLEFGVNGGSRPRILLPDPGSPPFTTHYSENAVTLFVGRKLNEVALPEGERIRIVVEVDDLGLLNVRAQGSTYPGVPMAVAGPDPRK